MDKLILTTHEELSQLIDASIGRALQAFHPAEQVQSPRQQYLTIAEAATYLSLAKQTLYGYTSNRTIPFIKRAKRLLFLKSDLDRWLAEGNHSALPKNSSDASCGPQHCSKARIIPLPTDDGARSGS